MRPTLYFAHPVNVYGTELESNLLARIVGEFPGYDIVNPNAPQHLAGYKAA